MEYVVDCDLVFKVSDNTVIHLESALDKAHELADKIEKQFGIQVVLGENYRMLVGNNLINNEVKL